MNLDHRLRDKQWLPYTIAACSAVSLYVILGNLPAIFRGIMTFLRLISPILIAVVISYILDPIAGLYRRTLFSRIRSPRTSQVLSGIFAILSVSLFVIVLMIALVPQVVTSIRTLLANASFYAQQATVLLSDMSAFAKEHNVDISPLTQAGNDLIASLTRSIPSNVGNILTTSVDIGKSLFGYLISFILSIYFLLDKERIAQSISALLRALLPSKQFSNSRSFWQRSNTILMRFVAFELLDGLIIGVVNYLFMKITHMEYTVLISVLVGITNLVPTFGPIIGGILGALLLLLIDPWKSLLFVLFTLVLQTIDGYVLKPRLFGDSLGVPSVWILIVLIAGGNLFGVLGILLSIPVAAILSFVAADFIAQRTAQQEAKAAKVAPVSVPDSSAQSTQEGAHD